MKWKTEQPADGEEREFRSFAWLPTQLDDGNTVWLEYYGWTGRHVIFSAPPQPFAKTQPSSYYIYYRRWDLLKRYALSK